MTTLHSEYLGIQQFTSEQLEQFFEKFVTTNLSEAEKKKQEEEFINALPPSLQTLARDTTPSYEGYGYTKAHVESIYSIGYQFYNTGKWSYAITCFRLCVSYDAQDEKYLFSLALALEKDRQYYEAMTAYVSWHRLQPESPLSFYRAGLCLYELGKNTLALQYLQRAVTMIGSNEEWSGIQQRARLLIDGLTNIDNSPNRDKSLE